MQRFIDKDGGLRNRVDKMVILMYVHHLARKKEASLEELCNYTQDYLDALNDPLFELMRTHRAVYLMKNSQFHKLAHDRVVKGKDITTELGEYIKETEEFIKNGGDPYWDYVSDHGTVYQDYIAPVDEQTVIFREKVMEELSSNKYCDDTPLDGLCVFNNTRDICEIVCYGTDQYARMVGYTYDILKCVVHSFDIGNTLANEVFRCRGDLDRKLITTINKGAQIIFGGNTHNIWGFELGVLPDASSSIKVTEEDGIYQMCYYATQILQMLKYKFGYDGKQMAKAIKDYAIMKIIHTNRKKLNADEWVLIYDAIESIMDYIINGIEVVDRTSKPYESKEDVKRFDKIRAESERILDTSNKKLEVTCEYITAIAAQLMRHGYSICDAYVMIYGSQVFEDIEHSSKPLLTDDDATIGILKEYEKSEFKRHYVKD